MTDERLEVLLKEQLQNKALTVDAKVVYKARRKAWLVEEKRHKKESMKALTYIVILHLIWMMVVIGGSFIVKGINGIVKIGLISLICSNVLIIIGCIFMPYVQKISKEEERWQ